MPDEPDVSFEAALTELERIVEDLERGESELTAAMARYEDGVRLLRHCHRLLDEAEHSVALLTGVDEQGQPQTAPFDATATLAREAGPSSPPDQPTPSRRANERPPSPKSQALIPDDPGAIPEPPF